MAKKRNLDLFGKVIPAIDRKDYSFYDNLTEVELKELRETLSVIMRWANSIDASDPIMTYYYLVSSNYHANKHFYNMYKHPKLQWLMIVAGSPNHGEYKRKWIGKKKKPLTASQKFILNKLREIYPTYKEEDIQLLASITSKKELTQYAKDRGEK